MRSAFRTTFTCLALSILGGGCSGLLGLDDFSAGTGGDASTGSSGSTTSDASSGSTVTGTSTASGSSTSSSDGGGGNATTSDGGGGSTSSDGGGGDATTSDGGGGSTNSDGGGGNATTSDGGGGSTSSDGGGGGIVDPGPTVVITSASVGNNQTTSSSRANFLFGSDPPGSAVRFECDLDNTGTFTDCTSGFDRDLLSGGSHELDVRGTNAQDVTGPVLSRRWTIEATGTTILALRQGTIADDTLVQISSNVRAMATMTNAGQQNIFVQDAGGSTFPVVRNRGIRTLPRNPEAPMTPGLALTVVGTFRGADGSSKLAAAEYVRGAQLAPYATPFTNDTTDLDDEALESVVVRLGGEVPTDFNCSSGCVLPAPAKCLEGCGSCEPLNYVDFTSTGTFDWGFYDGVLVGAVGDARHFWFFESSEGGDDICL